MFPCVKYIHMLGHATAESLVKVCKLLFPRLAIIPIHKIKNSDFTSISIPNELKPRIVTQSYSTENLDIIVC